MAITGVINGLVPLWPSGTTWIIWWVNAKNKSFTCVEKNSHCTLATYTSSLHFRNCYTLPLHASKGIPILTNEAQLGFGAGYNLILYITMLCIQLYTKLYYSPFQGPNEFLLYPQSPVRVRNMQQSSKCDYEGFYRLTTHWNDGNLPYHRAVKLPWIFWEISRVTLTLMIPAWKNNQWKFTDLIRKHALQSVTCQWWSCFLRFKHVNPLSAEVFWRNTNIYLHFISLPHTEMV